jgi:hypothetical protein
MTPSPKTTLPASIQAKLELGDTQLRPLGDVNTAMRDLNLDSEEVRLLVQLGYLVAFNIACDRPSRATRRRRRCKTELRVLTQSIEHFRALETKCVCRYEWTQLFRLLVPERKWALDGKTIQRVLNCDRGHLENLIAAKQLVLVEKGRPGPGGSPTICRMSLERFLKSRLQ